MPKNEAGLTVIALDGDKEVSDDENEIGSPDFHNLNGHIDSNSEINLTRRNSKKGSEDHPQVYNINFTDPTSDEDGRIPDRINPKNGYISQNNIQNNKPITSELHPNVFDDYYRKDSVPDIRFKYDEFVSRITCHGIQDWHGAHSKPSFVFWGVTFVAATAVLIYSIYKCLNDFYTEPINTSISVTPLNSIPFPDVYLCPTSFLNDTAFKRLDPQAQERALFFTGRTESSGGLLQLKSVVSDQFPPVLAGVAFGGSSSVEPPKLAKQQMEIVSASLKIGSFIPECQFTGRNVDKARENGNQGVNFDCRHLIERKLDIDYGVCYLIRLSKTGHQSTPAKGLSVVVDLLTEIIYPQDDVSLSGSLSDGIYVAIQSEYHPVNYQRILVSPGTHTQISLQAKEETFVSVSSFSKTPQLCVDEGEVEFEILNVSYTREACQFDCVQQAVMQNSYSYSVKGCLLPVDVNAIKEEYWNFTEWCRDSEILQSIESENYTKCVSKCHRACRENSYVMTASNHKIPSRFFRKKMLQLKNKANQAKANQASFFNSENTNDEDIGTVGETTGAFLNPKATEATPANPTKIQLPDFTEAPNEGISSNDSVFVTESVPVSSNPISDASTAKPVEDSKLPQRAIRNAFGDTTDPPFTSNPDGHSTLYPQLTSNNEYAFHTNEPSAITEIGASNQYDDGMIAKGVLFDIRRWEQNVIILDVSFDKLEVTSVTQSKAMTVMSLLGNLGGVSGLWLGASLFTVLQCIVFALKLCFSFCYTKNP